MSKQITYAEAKGKEPFDWNDFLDRAIANKITPHEYLDARIKAGDWVSCACGNQCNIIPRKEILDTVGIPLDGILYKLGLDFTTEITSKRYYLAKITLRKIEARSAELIAQIEKEASHE